MAHSTEYSFKLFLVGDSGVGKTCLMRTFCHGEGETQSPGPTVGVDFLERTIDLDLKKVNLAIWDTAGQERYRALTLIFCKNCAHGIIMVYDTTNRKSFENIRKWKCFLEENKPENAVMMLVGNKCNSFDHRQVSIEEGRQLAEEYGITFFETSSEKYINVEQAIVTLAHAIKEKLETSSLGMD